jgi:hypothetical protein
MGKSSTHELVGDIAENLNHLPRTGKEISEEIGRDTQSVKEYLNQLTNLPNVEKNLVDDEWYYYRTDGEKAILLEELADLEHQQWMHWSQYIAENYDIPDELREKWQENWEPYSKLSEEMKEKDRKWARKALKIMEDNGVFFGKTRQ